MRRIYEEPCVLVVLIEQSDVVRTSPGDEFIGDDFPPFEA